MSLQNEGDSTGGGEQVPRPTAAETHEEAHESFQAFKLMISQRKDKRASLHEVGSLSQLESSCFDPSNEGGKDIVRGPDGKFECQDSFYLALETYYLTPKDKADLKARRKYRSTSISQYFHIGIE